MAGAISLAGYLAFLWAICRFVAWWEESARELHALRGKYDSDFDDYYDEVLDSDTSNPMRDQDGEPPSFDAWWAEKQRPRLAAGETKLGQYR